MTKTLLLVFLLVWHSQTLEHDYCERDETGSCKKITQTCEDEDEPCFDEEGVNFEKSGYPKFEHLERLRGVKVRIRRFKKETGNKTLQEFFSVQILVYLHIYSNGF